MSSLGPHSMVAVVSGSGGVGAGGGGALGGQVVGPSGLDAIWLDWDDGAVGMGDETLGAGGVAGSGGDGVSVSDGVGGGTVGGGAVGGGGGGGGDQGGDDSELEVQ